MGIQKLVAPRSRLRKQEGESPDLGRLRWPRCMVVSKRIVPVHDFLEKFEPFQAAWRHTQQQKVERSGKAR